MPPLPPLPLWLAWTLAAAFAALVLHGGWRALNAEARDPHSRAPRPGIIEFGVGMSAIALLIPRMFEVYWP